MAQNFVSISGVSSFEELQGIKKISLEEAVDSQVVIGYQLSSKSINEGARNPRQAKFADLAWLDKQTRAYGFIPAFHYYTKDNNTIIPDVGRMLNSGIIPSLIQFNTLPPSSEILEKVKQEGFKVILKVAVSDKSSADGGYKVWKGEGVEDVSKGNPEALFRQIYLRRNLIEYAMFDPSHGNKLELDLSANSLAVRFGKMITSNSQLDNLGLIYAGGITPGNVSDVRKKLEAFFPNRYSIDIEGGIRIDNKMDLDLVRGYLRGCQTGLNRN